MTLSNMTKYFRQSLVDSENLSPADSDVLPAIGEAKQTSPNKLLFVALEKQVWLQGQVDVSFAKGLLGDKKTAEITIFPRVDLSRKRQQRPRVLMPLVVFAELNQQGELKPTQKEPLIPREWLAPNQGIHQPFAELAMLEYFYAKNPFEGIETWEQLQAYCHAMLCAVTQVAKADLYALALHQDYALTKHVLIQVEQDISGASKNIIGLLDTMLEDKTFPKLYARFCSLSSPKITPFKDLTLASDVAAQHIGQMTGEFALAPKQRNALHYFMRQHDGDILAVNGPPGTGKTTLLRTVVANMWTKAAIDEGEPPLIVAASNNNQAVTNILDSFANVDEKGLEETLKGRWLPEVESYGLYFCSGRKAQETEYMHYIKDGGCMQAWQSRAYIDKAERFFLQYAQAWNAKIKTVDSAKKQLHQTLVSVEKDIQQGNKFLSDFLDAQQAIFKQFKSMAQLEQQLVVLKRELRQKEDVYQQKKGQLDAMYQLWEQRSLLVRLLHWLPSIKKSESMKNARLLNQWDIHCEPCDDASVLQVLNTGLKQARDDVDTLRQSLDACLTLQTQFNTSQKHVNTWLSRFESLASSGVSLADQVNQVLDCELRFKAFKLATHYWEARWLAETQHFVSTQDDDKQSPKKTLRKLRRFAKLTPCFVSTFYMLPNFFVAKAMQDKVWKDIALYEAIDLLIVDEAGQALPEVSAASFALAKQALVVGDTDQIEPVWSVPVGIDKSNLEHLGLVKNPDDYEDFWLKSGLLASGGNIMRVAQRQCAFHQFETLQRGLYLTEHRRCFDSIINYCNTLVYEGALEPKRGEPKDADMFVRPLSLVESDGDSKTEGGSRANRQQAEHIATWVAEHQHDILAYARQQDDKLLQETDENVLKISLGIITPFSKQSWYIKQALSNKGIQDITVGTVHSLQGAERLIVLFSSVYGEKDKGVGKFYDKGSNMLNVAVSRAKNAFVVFGHPQVFGVDAEGTPSALLRKSIGACK